MPYVYLNHLETPLGDPERPKAQLRHYTGRAKDWEARQEDHRAGRGAKALAEARRRGIDWSTVLVLEVQTDREAELLELYLKFRGNHRSRCPACRGEAGEGTTVIQVESLETFLKCNRSDIERRVQRQIAYHHPPEPLPISTDELPSQAQEEWTPETGYPLELIDGDFDLDAWRASFRKNEHAPPKRGGEG